MSDDITERPSLRAVEAVDAAAAAPEPNVVDLSAAKRERLEAEIRRVRASNEALVSLSKANLAAQAQTHAAVLALVEAETLAAIDRRLQGRVCDALNIDAARVFVEGHHPLRGARALFGAGPGLVGSALGDAAEVLGPVAPRLADMLYGPQAARMASHALVRLEIGERSGLMCLASAEAAAFTRDQGGDLVHFLARVLERRLAAHLKAPA